MTYRKSIRPITAWLTDILNRISIKYLDMPKELTFQFLGMESEDEKAADDLADARVKGARMTINEDRDRIGLPRYDFPEADMPMVMGQRGVVFLDGASKTAAPGVEIGPPQAPPTMGQPTAPNETAAEADQQDPNEKPPSPAAGKPDEEEQEAVKAELAAFRRFVGKRGRLTRPFDFAVLAKVDAVQAEQLNLLAASNPDEAREHAARLAKASDAGGRDRAPAGARRGDRAEYEGYPLHAARVGA